MDLRQYVLFAFQAYLPITRMIFRRRFGVKKPRHFQIWFFAEKVAASHGGTGPCFSCQGVLCWGQDKGLAGEV